MIKPSLKKIILKIGENAHGNNDIIELKNALRKAKPQEIISFWKKYGIRETINWNLIKEKIWQNEEEQNKNQFPFLQGDIISSTFVSRLAQSRSTISHSLWIVCTPSCDIVRRKFIRVAPLFQVLNDYKEATSSYHKFYLAFKTALFYTTFQRFSLPPMDQDNSNVLGYFAEFEEPFFLENEFKFSVTPVDSLTLMGWHLFNASLQQLETRANMKEEILMRS